jgi:hypothetical protein
MTDRNQNPVNFSAACDAHGKTEMPNSAEFKEVEFL